MIKHSTKYSNLFSIIQLTQIINTKMFKFISLVLILFVSNSWVCSPSEAGTSSAAGEWQYLIRRGDTNGIGGKMPNPQDCPFYVGYFKLDYREFNAKDFYSRKAGKRLNKGEYLVGSSINKIDLINGTSYEIKGNYTAYSNNKSCNAPSTDASSEKAPLLIKKANGNHLEWITDFALGNSAANSVWIYSADLENPNSMKGTLKAYACSGKDKSRKCKLLNTAKFQAVRINSIQAASGKKIFSEAKSKTAFMKLMDWLPVISNEVEKVNPEAINNSIYKYAPVITLREYSKPSIQAILPAYAGNGRAIPECQRQGGTGGSTDDRSSFCTLCKPVSGSVCAQGETPTREYSNTCYGDDGSGIIRASCDSCRAGSCKPG